MKLRRFILLLSMILLLGCSSNSEFIKVNWQGNLIHDVADVNHLYWSDGVQFNRQQKDSLTVNLAGFSHENVIYILVSLANESSKPITFYPKECIIAYMSDKKMIELMAIRPKNLDTDHFSFFNTVLVGAGNISRLFINLPIDMLLKPNNKSDDALSNIDQEFHDEGARITKKIFISTHTLFPESHYAGFMVFEHDEKLPISNQQFTLKVKLSNQEFEGIGNFVN